MLVDQDKVKRLRYYSRTLDGIEGVWIAMENRTRGLLSANIPLPDSHKEPLDQIEEAKKIAYRQLILEAREFLPAVMEWARNTPGMGEPGVARLLGVIGHPCYAFPSHYEVNPDFDPEKLPGENNPQRILVWDEPFERSVSDLWAYCGAGDPTKRRARGADQEDNFSAGNPQAKKVSFTLAEAAGVKVATGYLRPIYLERKEYYDGRIESNGKLQGQPWSKGHIHNAAIRFVRKQILKDIFNVAYSA